MKVYKRGEGEPEITVIGSVHGDEPAGKKAIEKVLSEDTVFKKSVQFIVANEKALEQNVRYTDTDLNRAFPGDKSSDEYEERLASKLLENVEGTKVLDIHTTHSYRDPFATFKDIDNDRELVKASGVSKAVYFPDESGLMTEFVEGIVVEAGYQGSETAVDNAVSVIRNFLAYYGVIESEFSGSEPEIYEYFETVGGDWKFRAENFEKVEKNQVYAINGEKNLRAENEFYPVLMSTDGYENMLGFKAKKI